MSARDLLQRATGLDLAETVVERAVGERMAQLGIDDCAHYLARLAGDELQALTELVVVPESWMFRDADAFVAATRAVRERLAANPSRPVRILSIPCAGGEEPYSMAMALCDAGVAPAATVIDAVDLSEVSLARARRGRYTRNAFRGHALGFRDRYFTQHGNEYQINDALRGQVNFSHANLLTLDTAGQEGRYDIIFCRNLLIYFDEPTTAAAVQRLHLLLADDGLLFAGYAEVPAFCSHGFTSLRAPGAFALQKERRVAARPGEAVRSQPLPPPPAVPRRAAAAAPPPVRITPAPAPAAPDPARMLEQAGRLADSGQLRAAADLLHQVLRSEPDSSQAYYLLGVVSECEQKPGAADGYWRRCIYLQPDHYEALCHLSLLAEQQGQMAQAAAFRQRAARVYQRLGAASGSKP